MKKEVPFSVSRGDARSLVAQVADGLREAIVGGYYKPGEVVPTSRDLAPMLGVSRIVTIAALEKLCAEGFIVSRPRIGSVVVDRSVKRWNGHVVLVYEKGDDNYLKTMLASSMQDRLTEEGWLFSQASVGAKSGGGCDFTHLDVALSRSVDLVVVMYHRPEIYAYLAKRKIPYIVLGEKSAKPASAVGAIHFDYNMATADFAAACKSAGIREVVEVYWHKLMCDALPALKKVGIKVKKVRAPVDESEGRLVGVKRAGRIVFEKLLSRSHPSSDRLRGSLRSGDTFPISRSPLFFIADDYLSEGALLALSCSGLKAPDDVRIVTWANAGLGPDYMRPLSRMEMNPFTAGATVAAAIVEYFKTGEFPANVTVGPKWIAGDTMMCATCQKQGEKQ